MKIDGQEEYDLLYDFYVKHALALRLWVQTYLIY